MRLFRAAPKHIAALALVAALVATLAAPGNAQTGTPAPTAWPVTSKVAAGGSLVLYEPQIRSWANETLLAGLAAVAVTLPGATAPVYGTLHFTAVGSADAPSGTVTLVSSTIASTHWPAATATDAAALDAFARANLVLTGRVLPLAAILAGIGARPSPVAPERIAPPAIYVSQRPAVLVLFAGAPSLQPIAGTSLEYVANTNLPVVFDPGPRHYYLLAGNIWMMASPPAGTWLPATAPPSFAALPATPLWAGVRAHLRAPLPAAAQTPRVIVSSRPAALIALVGPPRFASIPGTQLRYVTNTANDLFFSRTTTLWYVLLAGHWLRAANLNGPWAFTTATLPSDFQKIPETGPRGRVLVSVPGTNAALFAANAARAPRIVPIDPATLTLTVSYSGPPAFAPIAGTPLQAAVNTHSAVVKVSDAQYYACHDGVWFVAAAPLGPWAPATYVPATIYTIPPSSPLYPNTFVYVYDANGIAQTAPHATPAPQPQQTDQTFSANNFSNGDRAAYYSGYSVGYLGGNWGEYNGYSYGNGYGSVVYFGTNGFYPMTYGNFDDTTYARTRAAESDPAGTAASFAPAYATLPGRGPRIPGGTGNNVYAGDDGNVYRFHGNWQQNAAQTWADLAGAAPTALQHDREARLAGYRGR